MSSGVMLSNPKISRNVEIGNDTSRTSCSDTSGQQKNVLNPMVVTIVFRESVDNPETVTTSPTDNPCGSVANPTTLALKLSYSKTMFSTLLQRAIDMIFLPSDLRYFCRISIYQSHLRQLSIDHLLYNQFHTFDDVIFDTTRSRVINYGFL